MSLTQTPLPYGLRDVKIFPLVGDVAGDGVDLPNSQTFTFSEAEEFEELRGDDTVVAVRGKGASVNWELTSGGVPLEALAAIGGGSVTESGVTPNIKKRYRKNQNNTRPYFKVEGKALSDSGGDFHIVLYRCRCTGEISGSMADGTFWIQSTSGRGIGRESDGLLFDFIQNESEEIVNVVPEMDEVVLVGLGNPTAGTFTLTFGGETTAAIAWDASPTVVEQELQSISSVGLGNAVVGGNAGGPYTVTFVGDLASTNVGAVTGTSSLTPVGTNEVVTLTQSGSGLTSFTVAFGGQTTASIAHDATAEAAQTALSALSTIGNGNVSVGRTGSAGAYVYTLTFVGNLAGTDVGAVTATPTGGTGAVTPAVATPGVSGGVVTVSVLTEGGRP